MIERFFPDLMVERIQDINIDELLKLGIRGMILDIDNTLVRSFDPEPSTDAINWMDRVKKAGLKLCLVSNNTKSRVQKFNETLNMHAVYEAIKPRRRGFISAARLMDIPLESVAVVGDQIFTDVYGGNRLDMFTIIVTPLSTSNFPFIKLRRLLETNILNKFGRSNESTLEKRKQWKKQQGYLKTRGLK